jgi:hypothetical protein
MGLMAEQQDLRDAAVRECAAIAADLDRLKTLIGDAGGRLMASFRVIGAASGNDPRLAAALAEAVTALQFEDMAQQLTGHAQRRLAVLAAAIPQGGEDDDLLGATTRMQPVRQEAVSAGAIDLF